MAGKKKSRLAALFGAVAMGAVLLTTPAVAKDLNVKHSGPVQQPVENAGATIVDLSADPYNLSPAVNRIVTSVKEALVADQKVILLMGEEHATIAHARLPETVRDGLYKAEIRNPVIAIEQRNNPLQSWRTYFFPRESSSFEARMRQALDTLKDKDTARFRHLQTMTYAAIDWPFTPVTKLESVSSWIAHGTDIRLIDMAMMDTSKGTFLDTGNLATWEFIKDHSGDASGKNIDAESPEGMHLRNLWMAAQIRQIIQEKSSRVLIVQTGLSHLVGENNARIYQETLHRLLKQPVGSKVKLITVASELAEEPFFSSEKQEHISLEAQVAMSDSDTIIIRGGNETRSHLLIGGSFADESGHLARLHKHSKLGKAPVLSGYMEGTYLRKKFKDRVETEVRDITNQHAPAPPDPEKPRDKLPVLAF